MIHLLPCHSFNLRPGRHHAFTLIELLVVIAIIFMLISMLLPGVRKAVTKAKYTRWNGFKQDVKSSSDLVLYMPLDVLDTTQKLENSAVANLDPTLLVEQFKASVNGAFWIHGGGRWSGKSCLYFDGSDSVTFDKYSGITGSKARSISMWVKFTSAATLTLCYWGSPSGPGVWWLNANNGYVRQNNYWTEKVGTIQINDGNWRHVASVFPEDSSPNMTDIILYIDGVADTAAAAGSSVPNTLAHSSKTVTVGTKWDNSDYYVGYLDEFALYTDVLSAGEVQDIYEMGKP